MGFIKQSVLFNTCLVSPFLIRILKIGSKSGKISSSKQGKIYNWEKFVIHSEL